jgi:hypothetical protein
MLKVLRVSLLMLALTCSVSAGEIPNNVTGTPPPPASTVQEPTTGGEIQTTSVVEETATQIVLNLLGSVLSVF